MSDPQKRLHTLLTDGAVAGLSEQEQAELEALLDGAPIDPSYEQAAAGIELGLLDHSEALPTALEAAIVEQAARYWGFAELRPREPTLGSPGAEVYLGAAELEATPVSRPWERSDELVLESSLTNGRIIDPLGRVSPGESMRGEILPAAADEQDREPERARLEAEASVKRQRFESEVDAQLDALELRARAKSAEAPTPAAPPPPPAAAKHQDKDDDDDDFDLDDDDDDDDDDDEPAEPVASAGKRKRKPGKRNEAEVSQLGAAKVVALSRDRIARWASYVSAIAALLILAIALWVYARRDDPTDVDELQASVEQQSDKLEWSFAAKPDEFVGEGAGGSIVWSTELQAGVMVLRGLTANEPSAAQYQLWIVDGKRPADSAPVDGGVFDVPAEQDEVRIPIDAKLPVGEPKLFVITVEPPGGVVVSKQERVAMVASPG